MKIRQMEASCRRNGLALTVQRRVIMEALAGRTDHPSADQLYDAVRGTLRGISRTTVYRVLETLVGIGAAQRISNPEAKARFDADASRHHHILCTGCQAIRDVHAPELGALAIPFAEHAGFTVTGFSINLSGLCPACRDTVP